MPTNKLSKFKCIASAKEARVFPFLNSNLPYIILANKPFNSLSFSFNNFPSKALWRISNALICCLSVNESFLSEMNILSDSFKSFLRARSGSTVTLVIPVLKNFIHFSFILNGLNMSSISSFGMHSKYLVTGSKFEMGLFLSSMILYRILAAFLQDLGMLFSKKGIW